MQIGRMDFIRGVGLERGKNNNDASQVGSKAKRDVSLIQAVTGCTVVCQSRFLKGLENVRYLRTQFESNR